MAGVSSTLLPLLAVFLACCGTSVVGGRVTRSGNQPLVSEDFCNGRCSEFGPQGRCVRFTIDIANVCARYLDREKLPPAIEVVNSVTSVCRAPGEQGKHWEVEAIGKGNVNLRLLKNSPETGVEGKVRLSKGEWEGVQRVLRQHQASDNADYRQCVKALTPLFVNRISP